MDQENLKKVGIPVAIGFVVTGLVLAFVKKRFGIEIGDPVDLESGDPASAQDEQNPS